MIKKAINVRVGDTISVLGNSCTVKEIIVIGDGLVFHVGVLNIYFEANQSVEIIRSLDPYDAIITIRKIIVAAVEVGFNPNIGTWADDLFASQSLTIEILQKAGRYDKS